MKVALLFISLCCLGACGSSLEIETPRKEVIGEIDSTLNHLNNAKIFPSRFTVTVTETVKEHRGDAGVAYARRNWEYEIRRSEIFLMIHEDGNTRMHANILLRSEFTDAQHGITEIELRIGGLDTIGNDVINAQPDGSSFVRVEFRPIGNDSGDASITQYLPADLAFSRPAGDDSQLRLLLDFDLGNPLPSTSSAGGALVDLSMFFDL